MPRENDREATKKHISTACTSCRGRKVKCDGRSPVCSNCVLYKQRCEYNFADKRKISSKKTIRCLTDRIALLESILTSHGIDFPSDNASDRDQSPLNGMHSFDQAKGFRDEGVAYYGSDLVPHQTPFDFDVSNAIRNPFSSLIDAEDTGGLIHDYTDLSDYLLLQSTYPHEMANRKAEEHRPSEAEQPKATNMGFCQPVERAMFTARPDCSVLVPNSTHINAEYPAVQSTSSTTDSSFGLDWSSLQMDTQDIGVITKFNNTDDMMDQLSARFGSFQIAEDGQLRYFGATSNLHILNDGLSSLSRSVSRSDPTEREVALSRAGLDQMIDPEFRRHLEDLYFKWEDPAIHVVDQEVYFETQQTYVCGAVESPFYSETLMNAICASGSCLTTRTQPGLPADIEEFFSSRARLLLQIEMDSPSIATVQALVIMSATEAALTRDARGWLYSGMAVRLSSDLGLHLDLSNEVINGVVSVRELDVRRTTFWGVFVHDNMWSLYVGRPSGINDQDISMSLPQVRTKTSTGQTWSPSLDSIPKISLEEGDHGYNNLTEACTAANVSLGMMMNKLSKTVYSGRTIPDSRLGEFAASMRNEFDEWEKGLPIELRVNLEDEDQFVLPHVLQLHMQFYAISILLHRPFFSQSLSTPHSSPTNGFENPRAICIAAAQTIVRLLRTYRKQHTLRRTNVHIVHLVFTASLICIFNAYSNSNSSDAHSLKDLQFCCQALGEIGEAFQNSMRALEVVICIKREWLGKMKSMARPKRRGSNSELDMAGSTRQKKRSADLQEAWISTAGGMIGSKA